MFDIDHAREFYTWQETSAWLAQLKNRFTTAAQFTQLSGVGYGVFYIEIMGTRQVPC